MAIVTDPDDLDRWQVLVDPVGETISIRGLSTVRGSQQDTGETNGTTTFEDLTNGNFVVDGVVQGDILTIISGNGIGHYEVQSVTDADTLIVDRAINGTASNITYRINLPSSVGSLSPDVADGATLQAIYSFLKEEWKDLTAGLGNAPNLIQFTFPVESITREQFEIGGPTHSNWDWADSATKNLIRTGGWQVLNSSGSILADYAGIITLGSLDSDAQVYYQQHDETADPTDFVLTGPVNQAVETFNFTITGTGNSTVFSSNNTITRADGGNWVTDGYSAGGLITIRSAEDAGNNGTFTIASVQNATNGDLVVVGTPLTNNADDDSAEFAVNKRAYLKLFVRKKARTYAQSEIADIGVSTIETIVNRFPLAHVVDAAISTRDGDLVGGNPSTVFGTLVDVNSTTSGGGEGIADSDATDGVFEFTHTGALFTSTNAVYAGDAIVFTSGLNQNQYEIQSVLDQDNLILFDEPGENVSAPDNAVSYTTRTRYIVEPGNTDGVTADSVSDDGFGEFTSATVGDFAAAGVTTGDYIRITDGGLAGDVNLIGVYKIASVATSTLTVNIVDNENWTATTGVDFEILEPGMFLQQKSVTATTVTASTDALSFADANPDTITRDSGSFITDGYVPGMAITVNGTTSNDGTYTVATVSSTVLTLISSASLTNEGPLSGSQTINGEVGFVRELNQVDYSFNWRLFGNGCTLNQAFEFIQRQLRRASDIDEGSVSFRGDVTDLLMSFATPTGTGLNLFIDDLTSADLNNATFQDLTGSSRNFAFIAGVTITLNDNIINSSSTKVVVFFTNDDSGANAGNDFGTVNAIIVDDDQGVDMTATNPGTTLTFNYDYDNNTQRGGGSAGTNAPVTIVAIGTDTAQYVQTTGTIQRQNNNTFALVAALERNYSNP